MDGKEKQEKDQDGSLVGRKVRKFFRRFGFFEGKVVAYSFSRGFYKVEYDDGDREELELHEVRKILMSEEENTGTGIRGRKRGRGSSKGVVSGEAQQREDIETELEHKRKKQVEHSECKRDDIKESKDLEDSKLLEEGVRRNRGGRRGRDGEETKEKARLEEHEEPSKPVQREVLQFSITTRSSKRKSRASAVEEEQRVELPSSKVESSSALAISPVVNRLRSKHPRVMQSCEDDSFETGRHQSGDFNAESCDRDCLTVESSLFDIEDSNASVHNSIETPTEAAALPLLQPLPPSSGDLASPEGSVSELLAVYSFLRSFSRTLFLSPFCLQTFVTALHTETSNILINSIHVALLQALRRHFERAVEEGSTKAKLCLRIRDWNFLDIITWPSHLAAFLATYGFNRVCGEKITLLRIYSGEYYRLPFCSKLSILSFLCDHVMDTEEIRTALDMCEAGFTNCNIQDKKNHISSSNQDSQNMQIGNAHGQEDWNSDECVLCGMNGNLICCDGCPAAYHGRCVGVSRGTLPSGDWFCPECVVERTDRDHSKRPEGLRGADILGTDPYGRVFMATCGYLLVSESCTDSLLNYKYYNSNDIPKVLMDLERFHPTFSDIQSAILQHWNILDCGQPNDLIESETVTKTVDALSSVMSSTPPGILSEPHMVVETEQDSDTILCSRSRENQLRDVSEINVTAMVSTNFESCNGNEQVTVRHSDPDQSFLKNVETQTKVEKSILASHPQTARGLSACTLNTQMCNTNITYEVPKPDQVCQVHAYVNHYILGDMAATAAANLALISAVEDIHTGESRALKKKTRATTTTEQLKAFSQAPIQFYWPSSKRKLMEIPKERCGWCFSCTNSSLKRGCLLNQVAANLAAGAGRVLGGIRPTRTGPDHLSAVAGYLLHIEDNLYSLLVGPWENLHFRKLWRKQVELATCIQDIKSLLLQLESSVRNVALLGDWSTVAEDAPYLVLGAPVVALSSGPVLRKVSGRKCACRPGKIAGKRFSGTGMRAWGAQWRRCGRISRQLLDWQTLPVTIARQAGRQGGLKKIAGLIYTEGEALPKRCMQCAWRARVVSANTISQLALQVRCLDARIRWDDLFRVEVFPSTDIGCESKVILSCGKPSIHKKAWREGEVMYLVDSIIITKQNACGGNSLKEIAPEVTDGEMPIWVAERQVPLSLLKDFEERLQLTQQSKTSKWLPAQKRHVKPAKGTKKDVFEFLLSKIWPTFMETEEFVPLCGICKLKLLAGKVVQCQVCNESFHEGCMTMTNFRDSHTLKHICSRCLCERSRNSFKFSYPGESQKLSDMKKVLKNELLEFTPGVGLSALELHNAKQSFGQLEAEQSYDSFISADSISKSAPVPMKQSSQPDYNSLGIPQKSKWQRNKTDSGTRNWDNVVFPNQSNLGPRKHPQCFLCRQPYNPELLYIGCKYCPLWFHGDAFGVTDKDLADLSGFKCHKCQKRSAPHCPFSRKGLPKTKKRSQLRVNFDCEEIIPGAYEIKDSGTVGMWKLHSRCMSNLEANSGLQKSGNERLGQNGNKKSDNERFENFNVDKCLQKAREFEGHHLQADLPSVNIATPVTVGSGVVENSSGLVCKLNTNCRFSNLVGNPLQNPNEAEVSCLQVDLPSLNPATLSVTGGSEMENMSSGFALDLEKNEPPANVNVVPEKLQYVLLHGTEKTSETCSSPDIMGTSFVMPERDESEKFLEFESSDAIGLSPMPSVVNSPDMMGSTLVPSMAGSPDMGSSYLPSSGDRTVLIPTIYQSFDVCPVADTYMISTWMPSSTHSPNTICSEPIKEIGPWNSGSCQRSMLSFTELLSSEDDRVEELANIAMDFGDNWGLNGNSENVKSVYHDPQILMSSGVLATALEVCNEDKVISRGDGAEQVQSVHCENQDNKLSVRGKSACIVCSVTNGFLSVQCIGCGDAVHQQCHDWALVGLWTGHGWMCDVCKPNLIQGQDISPHYVQLADSRILLQS